MNFLRHTRRLHGDREAVVDGEAVTRPCAAPTVLIAIANGPQQRAAACGDDRTHGG